MTKPEANHSTSLSAGEPEREAWTCRRSEADALQSWLAKLCEYPSDGGEPGRGEIIASGFPSSFGQFQLEAVIGIGGYGVVFRALDTKLRRRVALKIPWPFVMIRRVSSKRVVDEARAIAALNSPNIVKVFNEGWVESVYFVALELIDGPTLAAWLNDHSHVPLRTAAQIVREIAEAVQIAHQSKIVHRDLKPSNVLLRRRERADGFPYEPVVTDFGLADQPRAIDESTMTASFAIVGTNYYMSPEQAAGNAPDVGIRSDIFSLGVILYELLCGRRPFEGDTAEETRHQIREDDPPKIRLLRKDVPRDLETIVLKCLEKLPSRRYATARDLADDLQRFLNHEPIKARRPTMWQRAWKLANRKPLVVLLVSLALVIAGLVGALVANRLSATQEIGAARFAAAVAQRIERQHRYMSSIRQAAVAVQRGNCQEANLLLEQGRQFATETIRRGIEWEFLQAQVKSADRSLEAHAGNVHVVRFSPQGKLLVSAGEDGRVVFWDTATWTKSRIWQDAGGEINALEFSGDGAFLATGGDAGRLVIHRLADNAVIYDEQVLDGRIFALAWLNDDSQIAVGGDGPVLTIVDLASPHRQGESGGKNVARHRTKEFQGVKEISALAYITERNSVAVIAAPEQCHIVDLASLNSVLFSKQVAAQAITNMRSGKGYFAAAIDNGVSSDGEDLLTIGDPALRINMVNTVIPRGLMAIRFSADSRILAGAFEDGSIGTWSVDRICAEERPQARRFLAHDGRAVTVDISPDSRWVASGGWDGRIALWRDRRLGERFDVPLNANPETIIFSPCGRWFAMNRPMINKLTTMWYLELYDSKTGRLLWRKHSYPNPPQQCSAVFSPQGDEVVAMVPGQSICGYDPATGATTVEYAGPRNVTLLSFQFSPDGKTFNVLHGSAYAPSLRGEDVLGPNPTMITCLDRVSGQPLRVLQSADGNCVGQFRTILGDLWIIINGKRELLLSTSPASAARHRLPGPPEMPRVGTVSADGRYLALALDTGSIYLWDLLEFGEPRVFVGHEAIVQELIISADNATIISTSDDGTARFWNIVTGVELLRLGRPNDHIFHTALHPDGNLLVFAIVHAERFGLQVHRLGSNQESLPKTIAVSSMGGPATDGFKTLPEK